MRTVPLPVGALSHVTVSTIDALAPDTRPGGTQTSRGRPREHGVGVFGFLQGRVGDRGLTGALPARELGDIVAQIARSLAADAAVSDYVDTDVRESFAQG